MLSLSRVGSFVTALIDVPGCEDMDVLQTSTHCAPSKDFNFLDLFIGCTIAKSSGFDLSSPAVASEGEGLPLELIYPHGAASNSSV
jgi:hypothetical protein